MLLVLRIKYYLENTRNQNVFNEIEGTFGHRPNLTRSLALSVRSFDLSLSA